MEAWATVSRAWAPERASCTQLVSTGAQMFPEAKGSAVPELTVQEIHSGGACVSKRLKAGQVARRAWLGYRFGGAAEFRSLRVQRILLHPREARPQAAQLLNSSPPGRAALLHSSLVRSDADLSTRLFAAPFSSYWGH